ncbi:Uncharacterised protein [Bordetella pertussis]|nr:Uncharacterised protein [Bordetella pertussis]
MALAPAPAGLSADVHWRMAPAGPARYADRIGRAAAAFSLDTTDLPGT